MVVPDSEESRRGDRLAMLVTVDFNKLLAVNIGVCDCNGVNDDVAVELILLLEKAVFVEVCDVELDDEGTAEIDECIVKGAETVPVTLLVIEAVGVTHDDTDWVARGVEVVVALFVFVFIVVFENESKPLVELFCPDIVAELVYIELTLLE